MQKLHCLFRVNTFVIFSLKWPHADADLESEPGLQLALAALQCELQRHRPALAEREQQQMDG